MSLKKHQRTKGLSNDWITPAYIIHALGSFDLDPCASIEMPWLTASENYTANEDGLAQKWHGRVWCNPPFDRYEKPKWMDRMAEHNNGILLVPGALETKNFKDYVWGKCAGLLALDHRPFFYKPDGSKAKWDCGCSIVLIAYGETNLHALETSGLGVSLKPS